eukprot:TRINITY_DN15474_c0_g2_i1.p1 TRINITY_DN15474_c0_g2~~TRINITY_DN15474_c0_g2_i1.p1  ORF type:complete len:842 (+),score=175.00 TRINITY_DN15474_c0_g2_i1:123-2648(+)
MEQRPAPARPGSAASTAHRKRGLRRHPALPPPGLGGPPQRRPASAAAARSPPAAPSADAVPWMCAAAHPSAAQPRQRPTSAAAVRGGSAAPRPASGTSQRPASAGLPRGSPALRPTRVLHRAGCEAWTPSRAQWKPPAAAPDPGPPEGKMHPAAIQPPWPSPAAPPEDRTWRSPQAEAGGEPGCGPAAATPVGWVTAPTYPQLSDSAAQAEPTGWSDEDSAAAAEGGIAARLAEQVAAAERARADVLAAVAAALPPPPPPRRGRMAAASPPLAERSPRSRAAALPLPADSPAEQCESAAVGAATAVLVIAAPGPPAAAQPHILLPLLEHLQEATLAAVAAVAEWRAAVGAPYPFYVDGVNLLLRILSDSVELRRRLPVGSGRARRRSGGAAAAAAAAASRSGALLAASVADLRAAVGVGPSGGAVPPAVLAAAEDYVWRECDVQLQFGRQLACSSPAPRRRCGRASARQQRAAADAEWLAQAAARGVLQARAAAAAAWLAGGPSSADSRVRSAAAAAGVGRALRSAARRLLGLRFALWRTWAGRRRRCKIASARLVRRTAAVSLGSAYSRLCGGVQQLTKRRWQRLAAEELRALSGMTHQARRVESWRLWCNRRRRIRWLSGRAARLAACHGQLRRAARWDAWAVLLAARWAGRCGSLGAWRRVCAAARTPLPDVDRDTPPVLSLLLAVAAERSSAPMALSLMSAGGLPIGPRVAALRIQRVARGHEDRLRCHLLRKAQGSSVAEDGTRSAPPAVAGPQPSAAAGLPAVADSAAVTIQCAARSRQARRRSTLLRDARARAEAAEEGPCCIPELLAAGAERCEPLPALAAMASLPLSAAAAE